jgi:hypothetical protein
VGTHPVGARSAGIRVIIEAIMRYRGPTPAFWAFMFALLLWAGIMVILLRAFQ